ncbi:MAG: DUF2304 domain-containing protein [Atopobiaceae bacterium]|nr:DUF2304 domain-containing protein [Atopobiaceae bacterium]
MPLSLRLVILAGALLIIATILNYIRKRRILMADATSWVCIAILLLLIAIFPGIVTRLSGKLGFQSPANFVFLVVTGLLTVKTFRDSAKISLLRHKIEELAQETALEGDARLDPKHDGSPR